MSHSSLVRKAVRNAMQCDIVDCIRRTFEFMGYEVSTMDTLRISEFVTIVRRRKMMVDVPLQWIIASICLMYCNVTLTDDEMIEFSAYHDSNLEGLMMVEYYITM